MNFLDNEDDLDLGESLIALGIGIFGGIAIAAILESIFGKRVCPNCNTSIESVISTCPRCYTRLR